MENASKALIIAGAILIAILLIGVGMMVFRGAQGGIDEAVAQMSSNEKQMYNNQFDTYSGTKVRGSNVKALIGVIITNNQTNADIEQKQVKYNGKLMTSEELSKERNTINSSALYNVEVVYDSAGVGTGLIDNVKVNLVSSSN
ncbi:MAG: hypothetical protein HFJ53_06400 [Clostridia bacterium]|jgi:hypothetical protein|nr:hypothetical protein [Clostridia bacterium]